MAMLPNPEMYREALCSQEGPKNRIINSNQRMTLFDRESLDGLICNCINTQSNYVRSVVQGWPRVKTIEQIKSTPLSRVPPITNRLSQLKPPY